MTKNTNDSVYTNVVKLGQTIISRTEPNGVILWIPEDEGNRHYQEYLAWLAEGNEPEVIE